MDDNASNGEDDHNEENSSDGGGDDDGGGDGDGGNGDETSAAESDGEQQQFDKSLAASHSYMGAGLVTVSGRSVLEAGWRGRVPVAAHTGAVFPGETVPMLLPNPHDAVMLNRAIQKDKLFGLLCPDETGSMVSGYGVLCEVFEAGVIAAAPGVGPQTLSLKARANHRFRLVDMPKHALPMHVYARMRFAEVRVLPEVQPGEPLRRARLAGLDSLRRARTPLDRRLRSMDAALTPWPLFVYDIFDYHRMRDLITNYFKSFMFERLPEEPVSLSFWVASNLALSARDRLALFMVDDALLRLHMELRFIERKSVLCCSSCVAEIARREHILAMSSEGVHSNYTNPAYVQAGTCTT
ncbi:protein cereblon-like isoform X2 [Battus philenor]|uniref:protein cereblon-like isoform X2 n=1 Tax=Battus philenor TaxID=42288 RepID=UPI0035D0173A